VERKSTFNIAWLGVVLLLPQVLLVFIFFYWPTGAALYWSFTLEQPWGGGNEFVGLDNFSAILGDSFYWQTILRSIVFALGASVLAMGMGLTLALFCDRQLKGHKYYRSVLVWPYAVVAPAAALAFRYIFAPEVGLLGALNSLLPGMWNPSMRGWQAMTMIVICFAWKYTGYVFIFFLAALQSIPRHLIEAAAMDGAGVLRQMRDIQMPLLTPTFFFLLVVMLTESFRESFAIVDIMTEGGPAKATEIMVYKIYSDGFRGLDYSGAAAQSIILMVLIMLLTFVQFRFVERRVHYK
jgi:sn-glycerol 3-phosphate transport system permease protein